ncbi:MAG: hypothetical protein QOF02_765 [Blastocatellia bacterium]|jgi:hypothetical protein|nr:hypothetical protein [Blastocatellia bacterium]
MTKRRIQLFAVGLLLLFVLSIAGLARFASAAQETAKTNELSADPALKELAHYRQWSKASEKPVPVFDASVAG